MGKVLNKRYQVHSELGRGGMGVVYGAEDLQTQRPLAIKALHPTTREAREFAARFQREAFVQSMLGHPNIVEVESMGALPDGTLYLVMERVTGVRVDQLIETRTVGPRKALVITRQVLLALSFAHQHGVVHRDLKPENIMLVRAGEPGNEYDLVKLIDFGLATLVDDVAAGMGFAKLTMGGMTYGTPAYMAPEQALGRSLDGRTDLYSMGITLFEMLTGDLPFSAPMPVDLLRMHLQMPVPQLRERLPGAALCTPEMEALVAGALAKRPSDRFATARQMTGAVERAFESISHLPAED